MLTTKPEQRNYKVAALVGLIAGLFSAIVKFAEKFRSHRAHLNAMQPILRNPHSKCSECHRRVPHVGDL